MKSISEQLFKLEKEGNPLAQTILDEEIPELIENLKSRLNLSTKELDLTPESLLVLAKKLMDYYHFSLEKTPIISQEVHIQIVREVTAYFGEVVVRNSDGKKRPRGGLLGMDIVFDKPSKAIKGDEERTYSKWVINLGQIATSTWDAVLAGVEPNLYKVYKLSIASNVRENL